MNNLGILFRYEWKKIWKKKIVWIMGSIVIVSFLFSNLSFLIPYETVQTDSAGNSQTVRQGGYTAHVRECKNARKLDGRKIDEQLLKEMWKEDESEEYKEIQAFLEVVHAGDWQAGEAAVFGP